MKRNTIWPGMRVLKTTYEGNKLTLRVQYNHGLYEVTEDINTRDIRDVQESIFKSVQWLAACIIKDKNYN